MRKRITLALIAAVILLGGTVVMFPQIASTALTGYIFNGTIRPGSGIDAYGMVSQPTFSGTSSHTRNNMAAIYAYLSTTTVNASNASAILIPSFAAVGSDTYQASGIRVSAPTGATNNDAIDIVSGTINFETVGSTLIGSGTGTVKMSTAGNANNAVWLPLKYQGTTYYFPGWSTNAP